MTDVALSVIIADDEAPARHGLRRILGELPNVTVLGEAQSGAEAFDMCVSLQPDAVFLDVQMPRGTGLQVAQRLIEHFTMTGGPAVVFATAYDAYAIEAFDALAIGYILKPYDPDRVAAVLERVRTRRPSDVKDTAVGLDVMLREWQSAQQYAQRLSVRVGHRIRLVAVSEIDYLEADGNYVKLHLGTRHELVRETLSALERRLNPRQFARVHRSLIVNLRRVVEAEPVFSGEYVLFLANGQKIATGRTFRERVRSALGLRD